jgi:hypothetical protein
MMLKTTITMALLLTVLAPKAALAQPPELITDRPDFTESSSAVPVGYVQTEMGVAASLSDPVNEIVFPALLLRAGVLRNFELRVGAPSATVTWLEGQEAETTAAPLELGAKYAVSMGPGAVGLLPYVMLPVRSGHDTDGVATGIKGLWSLDMTDRLSLGGNVGIELSGLGADEGEVDWDASLSLSFGVSLTERLGTFVELYSLIGSDNIEPYGQTGLVYLLLENLQLDIFGAVLLDEQPVSGQVGMGASLLF